MDNNLIECIPDSSDFSGAKIELLDNISSKIIVNDNNQSISVELDLPLRISRAGKESRLDSLYISRDFTYELSLQSAGGVVTIPAVLYDTDSLLTLSVDQGIEAQDISGAALNEIELEIKDNQQFPTNYGFVIGSLVYEFGPDGATFDPPIEFKISYDPSEFLGQFYGDFFSIGYFNGHNWVELPTTVDEDNNMLVAEVSHFTPHAILYDEDILGYQLIDYITVRKYTLSADIKASEITNKSIVILERDDLGWDNRKLTVFIDELGRIGYATQKNLPPTSSIFKSEISSNVTITPNTEYNLIIVARDDNFSFYVDGVLQNMQSYDFEFLSKVNPDDFDIIDSYNVSKVNNLRFNGTVSNIAVYEAPLSSCEITKINDPNNNCSQATVTIPEYCEIEDYMIQLFDKLTMKQLYNETSSDNTFTIDVFNIEENCNNRYGYLLKGGHVKDGEFVQTMSTKFDCNMNVLDSHHESDEESPFPECLTQGVCQYANTFTGSCTNNQWINCEYPSTYIEEETPSNKWCDRKDNDCDGKVDEGCTLSQICNITFRGIMQDNYFYDNCKVCGKYGYPEPGKACEEDSSYCIDSTGYVPKLDAALQAKSLCFVEKYDRDVEDIGYCFPLSEPEITIYTYDCMDRPARYSYKYTTGNIEITWGTPSDPIDGPADSRGNYMHIKGPTKSASYSNLFDSECGVKIGTHHATHIPGYSDSCPVGSEGGSSLDISTVSCGHYGDVLGFSEAALRCKDDACAPNDYDMGQSTDCNHCCVHTSCGSYLHVLNNYGGGRCDPNGNCNSDEINLGESKDCKACCADKSSGGNSQSGSNEDTSSCGALGQSRGVSQGSLRCSQTPCSTGYYLLNPTADCNFCCASTTTQSCGHVYSNKGYSSGRCYNTGLPGASGSCGSGETYLGQTKDCEACCGV